MKDDFFGSIRYQTGATPEAVEVPEDEVRRRYLEIVGLGDEIYNEALGKYSLEDYWVLRALAEERDPFPGFDVAIRAHELVDAVYRSAAEGGEEITTNFRAT